MGLGTCTCGRGWQSQAGGGTAQAGCACKERRGRGHAVGQGQEHAKQGLEGSKYCLENRPCRLAKRLITSHRQAAERRPTSFAWHGPFPACPALSCLSQLFTVASQCSNPAAARSVPAAPCCLTRRCAMASPSRTRTRPATVRSRSNLQQSHRPFKLSVDSRLTAGQHGSHAQNSHHDRARPSSPPQLKSEAPDACAARSLPLHRSPPHTSIFHLAPHPAHRQTTHHPRTKHTRSHTQSKHPTSTHQVWCSRPP